MSGIIDSFISSTNSQTSQTQQTYNNDSLPTSLNDPRMNETKQLVNQYGGNAKAAFFALCKQKMANPMDIFNQLLGRQ